MKINSFEELEILRSEVIKKQNPERIVISVGNGTCCRAVGSESVLEALRIQIEKRNLKEKIFLLSTGCHGFCQQDPTIVIYPNRIFYCQVKPEDANKILDSIIENRVVDELLYEKILSEDQIPFFQKQTRFLTKNFSRINPLDITDYISVGGYSALSKALKTNPEEIINEVKKSGLRGRGGAGFPTGKKWELVRNAHSDNYKYIVCNGSEGNPGAFMDRSLIEGNPHSIIEGMIIGAYAICGRSDYKPAGYVYIRNEYPLAFQYLQVALDQAREYGFLGENILGSGLSFDIKIHRGAGAFVCGEETAMLQSIEGKVGRPSPRPPYPTECGLFGRPTNVNNVQTWASVPLIINNGAEWYSTIGTEKSKGTMIFSLVGKINNAGLVEVPMGIKLRELIYDIGGGIPNNKKFKAVQIGSPSGGCIPESLLDLPLNYEALIEEGSMMGFGGVIVMDEDTCMVEVARYLLAFTQDESCGKCIPGREGTKTMLDILTRITEGNGKEGDIELLEKLGRLVKDTSLCALGGAAPNPVLTTIKYFREEYEAHIKEKRCPAKVCKALITYSILADKCNGCHLCFENCPAEAISGEPKKVHIINQEKCIKCGICFDVCKFNAIEVK